MGMVGVEVGGWGWRGRQHLRQPANKMGVVVGLGVGEKERDGRFRHGPSEVIAAVSALIKARWGRPRAVCSQSGLWRWIRPGGLSGHRPSPALLPTPQPLLS